MYRILLPDTLVGIKSIPLLMIPPKRYYASLPPSPYSSERSEANSSVNAHDTLQWYRRFTRPHARADHPPRRFRISLKGFKKSFPCGTRKFISSLRDPSRLARVRDGTSRIYHTCLAEESKSHPQRDGFHDWIDRRRNQASSISHSPLPTIAENEPL